MYYLIIYYFIYPKDKWNEHYRELWYDTNHTDILMIHQTLYFKVTSVLKEYYIIQVSLKL